MKSFRNNLIRKAAAIMLTVLISANMLPLTANAFSVAIINFYPDDNILGGYIESKDPSSIQVKITTSVTEATYTVVDDLIFNKYSFLYDDNNDLYWQTALNIHNVDNMPTSIQVSDDNGDNWTTLSLSQDDHSFGYKNPAENPHLDVYRIKATEDYSSVSAGTYAYMQGGDVLVNFTPSDDDVNDINFTRNMKSIGFHFSRDNQFDMSRITPDDFSLYDLSASSTPTVVPITKVNPFIIDYDRLDPMYSFDILMFETDSGLIRGHNYVLSLSNTAGGDEIKRLPAGIYDLVVLLGHPYTLDGNVVVDFTNVHRFNDVSIRDSASGDSSAPSNPSSNEGTSGVTTNNGNFSKITMGNDGVVLGPGSDSVKTVTTADGRTETTVSLESKDMSKAFEALESNAAASHKIHINVDQKSDSTKFELPAGALADKSKSGSDTVISFSSGIGSIDIPIRAIDYQELAKQLGVSLEDVKLFVTISAPNAEQDNKIREQAKAQNVNISKITNFSVAATGGGKSQEITSFGKTYVQRTIQVSEKVAGKEYMAVIIDSETGELQFIPSSVNAKGEIVIMAPHASTYAIVEKAKVTFSDIRSHWAKSDIETLASKLLVKGTSADTFSPDKDISRAEFAALIARGLGLEMVESDTAFTDVAATGWYAKAVRATVQAGIVQGRTDTTFAPSATITREEMSVMLAKALAFVGRQPDVSAKQSSLLAAFADNANISDWAKAFAAQSVDAKVLSGDAQGKFNPQQKATRAEAVSTLKRLLDYIKFIN